MAPKKSAAAAAVAAPAASPKSAKKEQTVYAGITNKTQNYEFGGPIGVTALMIWSHYILIYFW